MSLSSCFQKSLLLFLVICFGGIGISTLSQANTLGDISCHDAKQIVRWYNETLFQADLTPFLKNTAYTLLQDPNGRSLLVFSPYATSNQTGHCLVNRFFLREGNHFYQLLQDYSSHVSDMNFLPIQEAKNRREVTESRIKDSEEGSSAALWWRLLDSGQERLEVHCCKLNEKFIDNCDSNGTLFTAISSKKQEHAQEQWVFHSIPRIRRPLGLFSFVQQGKTIYLYADEFDNQHKILTIHLFVGIPGQMREHILTQVQWESNYTIQTKQGEELTIYDDLIDENRPARWKVGKTVYLAQPVKDEQIKQKLILSLKNEKTKLYHGPSYTLCSLSHIQGSK